MKTFSSFLPSQRRKKNDVHVAINYKISSGQLDYKENASQE